MASMLSLTIKKEDDILPRPIHPKRKSAIMNIQPRARFAKARPNIGLGVSKTFKSSQSSETESKIKVAIDSKDNKPKEEPPQPTTHLTPLNVDAVDSESQYCNGLSQTVKEEPGLLPRPAILPKRSLGPAAPRARYQKARPNIPALANKISKESSIRKESSPVSTSKKHAIADSSESKETESTVDLVTESGTHSVYVEEQTSIERPVKGFSFSMGEVEYFPDPSSEEAEMSIDVEHANLPEDKQSCEHQVITVEVTQPIEINENGTSVPTADDYVVLNESEEIEFFECSQKQQQKKQEKKPKTTNESDLEDVPPTPTVNKPMESPTPTVNKLMEYPTLKSILNSPRKRAATKKTYERKKRLANLSETPSRSEMTMTDLIYYNPTGEPMKISKPQSCAVENLLPADENVQPPEEEPEDEDNANATGPKVTVDENGEIIVDESSLVVRRKETIDTSIEAIVENDNTTYSSFRKRSSKQWTSKETAKFYKALSLVGTDFALMENIFSVDGKVTRSRRELKLKFKREEKLRIELVHRAMYEMQTYDISILDDDPDNLTAAEDVDDAPVVKKRGRKPKADGSPKKPAGHKRKKKSDTYESDSVVDESEEGVPELLDNNEIYAINEEVSSNKTAEDHSNSKSCDQTKSKERPQRVRKTKKLSDFITDVDDSSNSSVDYISDTECEPIINTKKAEVGTEYCTVISENIDNNGQSLLIEKPARSRKRKKAQVLSTVSAEPPDVQDTNNPSLLEVSVNDVSRLGRVRKAKVLADFVTDEMEFEEAVVDSDGESVIGIGKRRKVLPLSECSSEECLDENEGEKCIFVEHISCLPPISAMEVIETVPQLVTQEVATQDDQDVICLSLINSPMEQDSTISHSVQLPVQDGTYKNSLCEAQRSSVNKPSSADNLQFPPGDQYNAQSFILAHSSEVPCIDIEQTPDKNSNTNRTPFHKNLSPTTVISSKDITIGNVLQFSGLHKHNRNSIANLLTDAEISEVVTTDRTKPKRVRRRAAAPNLMRGRQRPRIEEEKPQIQPSFSHFTPVEEQFVPAQALKTYSRKTNRTASHKSIKPLELDQAVSLDQAIVDPIDSFQNDQPIVMDCETAESPPVMIFTKSANNENILHLFMVKSPDQNF